MTRKLKINVYAPAFCDHTSIERDGSMEISEGDTLNSVLKKLGIPFIFRKILIASVNYERKKLSYKLKDGDVVSILGPVSSG
jgi:molybdopterin converting factor small subunit